MKEKPHQLNFYRQQSRVKEKLRDLEINIQSLLHSTMDDDHKRFVLGVLSDYKLELLKRINGNQTSCH